MHFIPGLLLALKLVIQKYQHKLALSERLKAFQEQGPKISSQTDLMHQQTTLFLHILNF